jgi:hypothetical protein
VDPAILATYVGSGRVPAEAIADSELAYGDQNERDRAAMVDAVREGRLEAYLEE